MEISIRPYKQLVYVLNMLQNCIGRNDLLLSKRLVDRELENIKGITEQRCMKRKLREDYCNFCDNLYCNINNSEKNEDKLKKMY